MALEDLVKIICDGGGAMDYDRLLELTPTEDLDVFLGNSEYFFVIQKDSFKKVIARTSLRLCKLRECEKTCKDLHLCKFDLVGVCSRRRCNYGHSLQSEHNSAVLQERNLHGLSKDQLRVLMLQSDSTLLPHVCVSYNKGSDKYGNCPDKEDCIRLHVCENYIRGTCDDNTECRRCHDFYEPHPVKTLKTKGVSSQLIGSLLLIYQNILTLKDHNSARRETVAKFSNKGKVPESLQRKAENVICLSFVKGFCKYGEKCWRIHFDMPYKWQVEIDQVWIDLPENEIIEQDYCNPENIHSVGTEPVCFDTMAQGLNRVRRLSTESSVLEPNFVLTTQWNWYWENEYMKWIPYGSVKEMHRLSSINCEDLEQKYLNFLKDSNSVVVRFTAGKQFYELNFRDMKQRNEMSGTERMVRRRPKFLCSVDVQRARARKGAHSSSYKGIPAFWDKTAIPDSGFRRVLLSPHSDKDYARVQEHFHKTMKNFTILTIERVQNKELWEDFQIKKERMKKANKDKKYGEGERLLFHGTKSTLIDAICHQNFDMRVSGANGTVYGQGSYFARDAKYSHDYTNEFGKRSMFACRVLIGQYTRGASHYRRPPAKDVTGTLYDSCVNDIREPTIYVVFERSQVYPEFLITYEEKKFHEPVINLQPSAFLAQPEINDITSTSKPAALSVTSPTSFFSDPTAEVSRLPSMISQGSFLKKYDASSTSKEPAFTSDGTNSVGNLLTDVVETTSLASSYLLFDAILVKTVPKTDHVFYPESLSVAQYNSSELPSMSGQDLVAGIEVPVKPEDHQLILNKTGLSDNTVLPKSSKPHQDSVSLCISEPTLQTLQQDSWKPVAISSLDSELSDLDSDIAFSSLLKPSANTPNFNFDYSPSSCLSVKASSSGNTDRFKSATNQKAFVSSSTSDFTEPAPWSQLKSSQKLPSLGEFECSDLDSDVLDSFTVLQSSPTKTKPFLCDHSSPVSLSTSGHRVSVSYKANSTSARALSCPQGFSEVSIPQAASSGVHAQKPSSSTNPLQKITDANVYSWPPPRCQEKKKSDCVVQ